MMELIGLFLLLGILTRLSDMYADDGLRLGRKGMLLGPAYGSLIAFITSFFPAVAPLTLAVVASCVLSAKIDHKVHYAGIATATLLMIYWSIPVLDLSLLALFIFAGLADEFGNDRFDDRKKGMIATFFRYRMAMELVAFSASLLTGNWMLFAGMLSFDIGYAYLFPDGFRRTLIRVAG